MALRADYRRLTLHFGFTARTSRGAMQRKDTWLLRLWESHAPERVGYGECSPLPGLSADAVPDYEAWLARICADINRGCEPDAHGMSSIAAGLETALSDLRNGGRMQPFLAGESFPPIRINGLIWMGSEEEMLQRIDQKLADGFRLLKLKIGGIDFRREIEILRSIRRAYPAEQLTLRLDANGAFSPAEALPRLEELAQFDIHSIEQPIRAGKHRELAEICARSPIPIALDEELIGLTDPERLLDRIMPGALVLKPSLHGGFSAADRLIALARERGIEWWATSALESNVGLNAIARWVSRYRPSLPQGLGTGQIYTNNIPSPLRLEGEYLTTDCQSEWKLSD